MIVQINQKSPIATNKFYAGFFLGTQSNAVWTHPYSLAWSKGTGNAKSWGLSVSHIEPDQRVGPLFLHLRPETFDLFIPLSRPSLCLITVLLVPHRLLTIFRYLVQMLRQTRSSITSIP